MKAINIIQIIFASQASLGALLLLKNHRFQGLVVLLSSASTLMVFNIVEELNLLGPHFIITPIFTLLNGPFWYLFIKQLVFNRALIETKDIKHLLPALLSISILQQPQIIIFFGTLSQIIYVIRSLKLVKNYNKKCQQFHSDAFDRQIYWVFKIGIAILIIVLLDVLRLNLQSYMNTTSSYTYYIITQLAYLTVFIYLIFKAVHQSSFFDSLETHFQINKLNQVKDNEKIFSKVTLQPIFDSIDQLIEEKELFLKPRLSIKDLSIETGLAEKEISSSINFCSNQSFSTLINNKRISRIKAEMDQDNSIQLIQIAFNCGFNSKSSFNAVFKKHTGLTPTQYQNRQKIRP